MIQSNYRFNPFSTTYNPLSIIGEEHTISYIESSNLYGIVTTNAIKYGNTVISEKTTGNPFTEIPRTQIPQIGQYRVDYDDDTFFRTYIIEFSSADNGKTVLVDYDSLGLAVSGKFTDCPYTELNCYNTFGQLVHIVNSEVLGFNRDNKQDLIHYDKFVSLRSYNNAFRSNVDNCIRNDITPMINQVKTINASTFGIASWSPIRVIAGNNIVEYIGTDGTTNYTIKYDIRDMSIYSISTDNPDNFKKYTDTLIIRQFGTELLITDYDDNTIVHETGITPFMEDMTSANDEVLYTVNINSQLVKFVYATSTWSFNNINRVNVQAGYSLFNGTHFIVGTNIGSGSQAYYEWYDSDLSFINDAVFTIDERRIIGGNFAYDGTAIWWLEEGKNLRAKDIELNNQKLYETSVNYYDTAPTRLEYDGKDMWLCTTDTSYVSTKNSVFRLDQYSGLKKKQYQFTEPVNGLKFDGYYMNVFFNDRIERFTVC